METQYRVMNSVITAIYPESIWVMEFNLSGILHNVLRISIS